MHLYHMHPPPFTKHYLIKIVFNYRQISGICDLTQPLIFKQYQEPCSIVYKIYTHTHTHIR